MTFKRIALDLAKNVFQVHGVDDHQKTVISRRLKRSKFLEVFAKPPRALWGYKSNFAATDAELRLVHGRGLQHDPKLLLAASPFPSRRRS